MITILDKREQSTISQFPLEYKTGISAGFDIPANERIIVPPLTCKLVMTGLHIDTEDVTALELGEITLFPYLELRPRSGLAFKHGITLMNSPATIDADYPAEIGVLIWNTSNVPFEIDIGDRIAQAIVSLTTYAVNVKTRDTERESGFGSTGI